MEYLTDPLWEWNARENCCLVRDFTDEVSRLTAEACSGVAQLTLVNGGDLW